MRLFEYQAMLDIVLFSVPTLVFIILFAILIGRMNLRTSDSRKREAEITEAFADDIQGRNAPFPLGMALIVLGTIVWGLAYIWFTGSSGRII